MWIQPHMNQSATPDMHKRRKEEVAALQNLCQVHSTWHHKEQENNHLRGKQSRDIFQTHGGVQGRECDHLGGTHHSWVEQGAIVLAFQLHRIPQLPWPPLFPPLCYRPSCLTPAPQTCTQYNKHLRPVGMPHVDSVNASAKGDSMD